MRDAARPHPAPDASVVWRTRDVAAFWQRTPTTVMRWVEAGDHPGPRLDPGGRPYWLAAEVAAFARQGCVDGGAPPQTASRTPEDTTSGRSDDGAAPLLALVIGDGGTS